MRLSPEETRRYGRQMVMPELGLEGQERLRGGSVLVVGAGGLGSPLALYLAAAGVGRLGLVDFDAVDVTNLQRQILYGDSDVGRPKIEAARERLADVNPHVELEVLGERFDKSNALELVSRYDVVADGSDNFATRYLVNDACVLAGRPNVFGSVLRFEGQVTVFWADRGPCYRCLFPEPPPPGLVPSCAEAGVLGALPGAIGSLQAVEVLKLLAGVGEPLVGRLLLVDALGMRFREVRVLKSADCPICSAEPTQTGLIEYEASCEPEEAMEAESAEVPLEVGVDEVRSRLATGEILLIDVRTPREYQIARIEGALLIPLQELPGRLEELDGEAEIVIHCHHGPRSLQATRFLRGCGFRRARNMTGGIDAWSLVVDPGIPRY